MAEDIVLKIEDVGKDYILGAVTGDTLKDVIKQRKGKNLDNDSLSNKKFTALNGINLDVRRGEAVGLIGSNGAGKSTLLKLISRITAPTRGRILINGRVASMLEVGTGFHPELTGRENIYLNGSILGMNKDEIDKKIDSIIEFSEIGDFIDTPVKRYSSGMYVKLAFSVAAHLDSEIMIMDEVLAVGDVQFQNKCLNKMKEIARKEGRTILYVSHNMETIRNLCDRCVVLNHGQITFDGAIEEAIRLYIGTDTKTESTADFSKYMRPGWLERNDVRLTWAEYVGKEDNIISDDALSILMKYKTNAAVGSLGLRVELMAGEEKPFATKVFYDVIPQSDASEQGEFCVDINLSSIADGEYQTFYTIFALGPYGEGVDLDCVRGLDIIIKRNTKENELHWRSKSWGNVIL